MSKERELCCIFQDILYNSSLKDISNLSTKLNKTQRSSYYNSALKIAPT